jgi:hypothetical protein
VREVTPGLFHRHLLVLIQPLLLVPLDHGLNAL